MPLDPALNEEDVRAWAADAAPEEGAPGQAATPGEEIAVPERAEDVMMYVANELEESVGKLAGIRAAGDFATKAATVGEKMTPFVEELRDMAADYMEVHGEMTQEERAAAEEAAGDMGEDEEELAAAEDEVAAEE